MSGTSARPGRAKRQPAKPVYKAGRMGDDIDLHTSPLAEDSSGLPEVADMLASAASIEDGVTQLAPASATDGASSIDIRLHPSVMSGWAGNRFDIVVTGFVAAELPVQSVSLLVGGEVKAFLLYSGSGALRQTFQLTLAQLGPLARTPITIEIAAQTQDEQERRVAFTLALDEHEETTISIAEGPTLQSAEWARVGPPVLMYVEEALLAADGVLQINGWAVAHGPILAVQVLMGDDRVGSAQIGRTRNDVAEKYPTYANARLSGFELSTKLSIDKLPPSIAIEAINIGGAVSRVVIPIAPPHDALARAERDTAALGTVPLAQPDGGTAVDGRRTIYMHCDQARVASSGGLVVSGWAVCASGVAAVEVSLDGELVGVAELGRPRPDVADEYPAIPQASYSGFMLKQQIPAPTGGEHEVHVLARNGLGDTRGFTLPAVLIDDADSLSHPAAATALDQQEFRLEIDNPAVIDGVVPEPVTGNLVVEGWALAASGAEGIEVFLDGVSLGQAYYGTARRDVETAFPDWPDALRSGYIFHFQPRSLETGEHVVRLLLKGKNGLTSAREFRIDVQKNADADEYATIRRRLSGAEIDLYRDIVGRLDRRPFFQLILAGGGPPDAEKIDATLRSLANQAYADWHVSALVDKAAAAALLTIAESIGVRDRVSVLPRNAGPDAVIPAQAPPGSCLIGVLSPGDELGSDALAEFAIAYGLHGDAQFFYADEDRLSPASEIREPFFKPAWSPDLLLSTNYIGRPWFATAALFGRAGVTPRSLAGAQGDYDAVLRCTELTTRIRNLPKVLCRRDDSGAPDAKAERQVLQATIERRGIEAEVLPGCIPGSWRVKRTAPAKGKVSIIIPTNASKGYVANCLKTLREKTAYPDYEIICIDNIPEDLPEWKAVLRDGADKIVDIPDRFNWSKFNNRAAAKASGKYLLFLNDDIEIEREDWLDAMLEHAQRPEVGTVGPQLLYPDRKVQHAGIFLTTLGAGRHSFRFLAEDDPGYFGLALTQRNVVAVTGACMLVRREVFERLGRFDESHEVVNNDVDWCLRSWQAGLSVVYTPHAQLIHHELASRAKLKDVFDAGSFAKKWRTLYAEGDPYFSSRLTKFADEYRPDTEPARMICAGRPVFHNESIRRILAVKLDHIGDLITALPALRRLRRSFPAARIHLLASKSAKAILAGEDCVDELIEFEFFHARSGLGQKGLTDDDMRALGERLKPYRFDLAIDMRKQLETRDVVRYIPARLRAGFDYMGRFPWLDIALEWEGDHQRRRKHSHVSDDLLRLVETIAGAGDTDRSILPPRKADKTTLPANISPKVRKLFDRPVAAVHPGVGAIMRQWLPEYFAAVIDLLVEKNGINVVLVGGPDEAELADTVLRQVVNRKHVASLAGLTTLPELVDVLASCALYLGNNSGPKHIAASLGVPTVGIHSGIVDAMEWGPVGPRAIAVQKNMVCSPCYLVKPEDCVRDMACMKRLEPAVVHRYCEMMLARAVPDRPASEAPASAAARPAAKPRQPKVHAVAKTKRGRSSH